MAKRLFVLSTVILMLVLAYYAGAGSVWIRNHRALVTVLTIAWGGALVSLTSSPERRAVDRPNHTSTGGEPNMPASAWQAVSRELVLLGKEISPIAVPIVFIFGGNILLFGLWPALKPQVVFITTPVLLVLSLLCLNKMLRA